MATNLRLRRDAEEALRAEAARTGRTQQDLMREAVDQYLHLAPVPTPRTEADALVASGAVLPPRSPFREIDDPIVLPAGTTTTDLLDREDRF